MAELNEKEENSLNNSIMILTIDIGNSICDKLRIHDINNYEKEAYDFCANNHLDFQTMREINSQIQKVINENKIFNNDKDSKKMINNYNLQNEKEADEKKNRKTKKSNSLYKGKKIPSKKLSKRYNGNKSSYINQRKNNKNNGLFFLNNNTRANTNSSKGSSIIYNNRQNNIIKNVKNAFKAIKKNPIFNSSSTEKTRENEENDLLIKKNIYNMNNFFEYSSNMNDNNDSKKNDDNIKENNDTIFLDLKEEKKENKFFSKKRKESIEIVNTEEINRDKKLNENQDNSLNFEIFNKNKEEKENNEQLIINQKEELNTINKDNIAKEKKIESNLTNSNAKNKKINKKRAKSERNKNKMKINQELDIKEKEKNEKNTLKNEYNNKNKNHSICNSNKRKIIKNYELSNEDIIKNYKKYKEEKYQNLKLKQEIELKKICTFHPKINKNSYNKTSRIFFNDFKSNNNDAIINKKSKSFTRFEKLYNDRISFKENKNKLKEKIEKEFSYRPKINYKKASYKMNNISFSERLKLYTNRTKEKKLKLIQDLENKRKINECFKPKLNINKNKELLKERDNLSDNQYEKYNRQYLYGQKYEQKKQYLTEKYFEDRFKSPECCQMTNELFNYKKEKSFKKIFKLLDGDNDGKISYNCITIKTIPIYIKNILEPIFYELKIENEELNEDEFIFVCEKYYNTLNYDQKRELILFDDVEKNRKKKEKIEKENINYSFRPKINKYKNLTNERNKYKSNRISSYLIRKNNSNKTKNRIKNINIQGFNYIFSNREFYTKYNNFNDIKNLNEKINIINNISFFNLLTKKRDNSKELNYESHNHINNNNLIIQNLTNNIVKEINYQENKK